MINATGVWADRIRPEEIHDEAEVPRIAPSRGTHVTVSMDELAVDERRLHRPGRRGPHDLRPALVRADADRDHRQRLRGRHRPRPARRRRHRLPARRRQRLLRHRARPRRPDRRLRRRAAADLDRRPAQVGRHLAQGRALRDLVGDADDHRRQADDLAADGQAGRRPAGRARGPRRALPHRRHPARDGGAPSTSSTPPEGLGRGRPAGRLPRAARASATATPPATCCALAGERPELARADRRRASPTCSPRPSIAARLEQARSVADVLLRRTRLGLLAAPQLRDGRLGPRRSPRRSGASWAGGRAASAQEAERWVADAAAEGIDPAATA